MNLKVLTFGIAREITGGNAVQIDLPDGASALDLKRFFLKKYPAFSNLNYLQIAVNQEFAADDQPILSDDEIALIPPVSGG